MATTTQNGQTTYDQPATFVNVKRVKVDKDSKGRDQVKLTFGLQNNREGQEVNTCDELIEALLPYRGKQVNLDVRIGEAESNGRKFPTAFVRVVEMIPKDAQTKTAYAPKESKTAATKARSEEIRSRFQKG